MLLTCREVSCNKILQFVSLYLLLILCLRFSFRKGRCFEPFLIFEGPLTPNKQRNSLTVTSTQSLGISFKNNKILNLTWMQELVKITHHGLQSRGCETSLQTERTETRKTKLDNVIDGVSFQESRQNRSPKRSSRSTLTISDLSLTLGLIEQNGYFLFLLVVNY